LAYECLPTETRAFAALLMGAFWVLGYCLVSPLAIFFTSWRSLLFAVSLPACVFGIVCLLYVLTNTNINLIF
jgi:hypothetical protein